VRIFGAEEMKTSELTGAALDWAVAKCKGWDAPIFNNSTRAYVATNEMGLYTFSPSTDWAQGGPIIEANWSLIFVEIIKLALAGVSLDKCGLLVCFMRCYVASKLGDTVDVPEELT
jgi:hypothetical protein